MRTYLLDTGTFILATAKGLDTVGPVAKKALTDESAELVISSLSAVEIAVMTARGRTQFTHEAIVAGMEALRVTILPFRAEHALRYFSLPEPAKHRDPIDRMLIAQALEEGLPVITGDKRFSRYPGLEVIW